MHIVVIEMCVVVELCGLGGLVCVREEDGERDKYLKGSNFMPKKYCSEYEMLIPGLQFLR